MCHERWFRRQEREERFEEELRFLMDREGERPATPTPVVEHEHDREEPVVERTPDEAPVVTGT
jgi:hypothetical protein